MPINLGKQIIGNGQSISYGNQSPAVDAVPLAWLVGDFRFYVGGVSTAILGWRCTVSGTPGTWVEIDAGTGTANPFVELLAVPFVFNGPFTDVGLDVFGAPASNDWAQHDEGSATTNRFVCSEILGASAPNRLILTGSITRNNAIVPVVNGIVMAVVEPSAANRRRRSRA